MSYQKHTWVSNEIIKKGQLNNIENGIYNEEQRAQEQEELLNQAIADETTRATNRETALASTINTLNVNLTEKINILNGDSTVEGSVDYKIEQAIANAGGYKITLDHTQEANPSTKYIYLEEDSTATGSDKFEEWIWYYDESTDTYSWRMIGEVSLDLSAYALKSEIPTKTSDLTNDSGFEANVQADWNETDTSSDAYIANKPTIPSGVTVDSALSTTSTNPVQNKVITNALANKVDDTDLATVATSGSYNDLSDKPTIPSGVVVDSALSTTSTNPVQNKLITNALNNKASSSDIPTNVSDLTNDSGFITNTHQYYGTCSTAAATQTKAVTVSNQNFKLEVGARVTVKYSVTNTYSATSSAPCKLNVNNTGAKNIYYNNSGTPTGTNTNAFGYANRIASYVYDGTYWAWDGMGTESDTRDFKIGTSRSGASNNILYFVYS